MDTSARPDVEQPPARPGPVHRWLLTHGVPHFGHPRGIWGRLVGQIMARRSSNRRRNVWAVELLDVQAADRVLEIGFGPGIAIRELSRRASAGKVLGIDHSALMVRQASRRNRSAIRAGLVDLRVGGVEDLSTGGGSDGIDLGGPVDKVLAVNSLHFWPERVERLRALRTLLTPGGTIALVSQPRCPGATAATSERRAQELQELLVEAGFAEPGVDYLDLDPPVACVRAHRPGPAGT